jgi:hypothetical protein
MHARLESAQGLSNRCNIVVAGENLFIADVSITTSAMSFVSFKAHKKVTVTEQGDKAQKRQDEKRAHQASLMVKTCGTLVKKVENALSWFRTCSGVVIRCQNPHNAESQILQATLICKGVPEQYISVKYTGVQVYYTAHTAVRYTIP